MAQKVAVIIVNFNSGALLERCLASLRAQTRPPDAVVVVDNASRDGSADRIEQGYPGLQVIRLARNIGFAAANNLALHHLREVEWIALLNPDAFPEPAWLETLQGAALAHPGYAFFASHLVDAGCPGRVDGSGDVYHVSGLAWRRGHGRPAAAAQPPAEEVFAPCAAAALYRRAVVLEAGGFDESFFCYFEDIDLAFRLRLLGYRCLYVPAALVHHVGSAITGRRSPFSIYHGHRNLVWTYFKNMPWPLFWLYLPQHLALNMVTLLWFILRGQGGIILKAKRDALRGLPRVWRQRRAVQGRRRVNAWEVRRVMSRQWLLWQRLFK